jgi:AcrR family transcriptional regulator
MLAKKWRITMPRLTRKDMQQQTRERLLAAAREVIAHKGIADASIRDIAETAGYSLGAFYSNFDSKEMMLEELVEVHMYEEISLFRRIVAETESGRELELLDKIGAWLEQLQNNKNLSAFDFELEMYAKRAPTFKKKFDISKIKRLQELADGLQTLFAYHGLKPKLDYFQMAIGFAALWSGFFLIGTVPGSKPFDEVIFVFLQALLDNATHVDAN